MTSYQCAGYTKYGKRCTKYVSEEGALCWFHDPAKAVQMQAARVRGGKKAQERLRLAAPDNLPGRAPETAAEAQLWSSWLIRATAEGTIGTTVSQKLTGALRVFLQALDKAEMEARIKELEAQVRELKRGSE